MSILSYQRLQFESIFLERESERETEIAREKQGFEKLKYWEMSPAIQGLNNRWELEDALAGVWTNYTIGKADMLGVFIFRIRIRSQKMCKKSFFEICIRMGISRLNI